MPTTISQDKKRTVSAPQGNLILNFDAYNIPSTVISVELEENESVEWIWTTYANGQRVVTGYNIIKSDRSESI